jgi:beta-galactosidase
MTRHAAVGLLAFCVLGGCSARHEYATLVPTDGSRKRIPLTDWDFFQSRPTPNTLIIPQHVTIPHTWNATDGENAGDYFRGACWYRRNLDVSAHWKNKTLVLRFEGANRKADLFVNGKQIGSHTGGFGAFAFDVTRAVHPGNNVLAVHVTNENIADSPPLSADFTFFGGIYRPVELLVMDPVHISPLDYASPGIRISTPEITADHATVNVKTQLQNSGEKSSEVHIIATVVDADGKKVAEQSLPVDLNSGDVKSVDETLIVPHPHRWNGRKDPYLYHVTIDVVRDGKVADSVTQPLGIRTFWIDPQKGFFLNGQPYHLHGVSRHQDRQDKGWAISNANHDEDMALIKEMGCTAIRLAHYQHSEYFYELCDKEGMIVWAEVPVVNDITPTEGFSENAEQQERELIRQNENHPSICFWSIGNEVMDRNGDPRPLFKEMNAIAHAEDPSRVTTMAFAVPKVEADTGKQWPREWWGITDTVGQNRYSGWYRGTLQDFRPFVESQPSEAISEYGAGASIYFHNENPVRMDHSEEYQCLFHETYWPAIHENPKIWGSFVWNMFDFGVAKRKEGDHTGRNDKGLVTYDRKTKKDAFYYYQANWSDRPLVHINSKRFVVRGLDHIHVKVYSNAPEIELVVNSKSLGKKSGTYATFTWDNVALNVGPNQVIARGVKDGEPVEDTCTWTYTPGAPAEVDVAQDETMREELKKGPPRAPAGDGSLPAGPVGR